MKRGIFSLCLFIAASAVIQTAEAHAVRLEFVPLFNGRPLTFDVLTNRTAAGQTVSVTRLDFLVSEVALHSTNGLWQIMSNQFGCVIAREGKTSFTLEGVSAGSYDHVRFQVGLEPLVNHGDSAQYAAGHPLNPEVNGLHWGWQGGYVFMALEGAWQDGGKGNGYSFHIANDPQLMTVELPVGLEIKSDVAMKVVLDVAKVFGVREKIRLADGVSVTHSRTNDVMAGTLCRNVERAFAIHEINGIATVKRPEGRAPVALVASNATPYRLTIAGYFPRPGLPLDNPITEEGVALGRALFNDKRLSVNNEQSCASCHEPAKGFSDGKRVSAGAEGEMGTRNAMALLNLAWKGQFFWDGRAVTLREQVLQPIQNPREMHEALTNVVAKLLLVTNLPCRNHPEGWGSSCGYLQAAVNSPHSRRFALQGLERGGFSTALLAVQTWFLQNITNSEVTFPRTPALSLGERGNGGQLANISRSGDTFPERLYEGMPPYPVLFSRAFGSAEITSDRMARALEQFLLVQVSFRSKFDRVIQGQDAFTEEEQRGFELFHTEYDPRHGQYGADCFHCHGGPLFQSQNFGNNGLDAEFADAGRYAVTQRNGDQGKFAVPSLRNVAVTGPYMHDGRFSTLEEAVEHYCTGMKRSGTLDPNLAKHPDGGVPLTGADKRALVAFLKTLTDEQFLAANR